MQQIGSQDPATAPWVLIRGGVEGDYTVVGYANARVAHGNQTLNAVVGDSEYWAPVPHQGILSVYNHGTLQGSITLIGQDSEVNLYGGVFDGSLTWESQFHFGNSGSDVISSTLGPDAVINIGTSPEFCSAQVELAGKAETGATINVNSGHLQLDRFQFLPALTLDGPWSSVTFQDQFSSNIAASWQGNELTIHDYGLNRTLTDQVSVSDPIFGSPQSNWVLIPGQQTSPSTYIGLTLQLAPADWGPPPAGSIHPTIS